MLLGAWTLDELENAAWVRDYPPSGVEGFSDLFLDDKEDYCSRRDNTVLMTWDGLGHFDVDERFNAGEGEDEESQSSGLSSSEAEAAVPSSSSRERSCYEAKVLGRFFEGPCSSASNSSGDCAAFDCGELSFPRRPAEDLEYDPKPMRLCFDELGHLIAIYECGLLRWHQDGWRQRALGEDAEPESSSSSREGVALIAFLPEPESSASEGCDVGLKSQCDPIFVRRVILVFDSHGHLFMVMGPMTVELPCGVLTYCSEFPMPKSILVTWLIWNAVLAGSDTADEQCTIATWDGCDWVGDVRIPCCHREGTEHELSYTLVQFKIGCAVPTTPPPWPVDLWKLCLGSQYFAFVDGTGEAVETCPVNGSRQGVYVQDGCDDVAFIAVLSEIPCHLECVSREFVCDSPSSTGITSSGGGPGGGGPG